MQKTPEYQNERIEHRCPRCRCLLAVEDDGRIHVRIKGECHFIVLGGTVMATCRRCGEMQEIVPRVRAGPIELRRAG